jgi:protein involved in temperature-dependent protein secretion
MKEIKITQSNSQKIEAVLREVNQKSTAHTYVSFADIENLTVDAESRLTELLSAKKHFTGAVFAATSGGAVANSYKYPRDATSVTLTRKPTGWFLTDAVSTKVYKDCGKKILRLTEAQDAIVYKVVRTNYQVQL